MSSHSLVRAMQGGYTFCDVVSNAQQDRSHGSAAAKRSAKLAAAVVLIYASLALTTFFAGMVPHTVLAWVEVLHRIK
jgi:hypothetical protein